jgi:nitrite reductase (NADH) small subunit
VSAWHEVGPFDELERTGRVVGRIGGREIGVVLGRGGELYGLRNRCPHHGAPLCLGRVRERVTGSPGRYQLAGRAALRCPWHGWEFDLETGRCLEDDSMRVAVYPAKVERGHVLVEASGLSGLRD